MSELEDMLGGILSDPEQMKKIQQVASSLMGGGEAAPKQEPPQADILSGLGDLPLGDMMGMAKKLMGSGGGLSQKTAILNAMKPWMSEKRSGKLEKAVKLAAVMKAALTFFKKSEGGL